MERTFVMLKPDSVRRHICGEIIRRFEQRNFNIVAIKMMNIPQDLAEKHYQEHKGKSFFGELIDFITSGPVIAMILEGEKAVSIIRDMMGSTDSAKAASGTIRGDYSTSKQHNIVHGSDSPESAEREINNFFREEEICPW